jgi:hypothetical protein
MAALDQVTLAEFKDFLGGKAGTARDSAARRAITRASREIEGITGRRLVYRAPPEVLGSANILPATNFANGALAGVVQPNVAGRTLAVTFGSGITAGVLTITGTVAGVAGTARDFDVANGLVQHGVDFFTAISAMSVAGAAGAGTVKVGSSLGYVEYHTVPGSCEFLALEKPFRQVLAVYEDPVALYAVGTLLTAADYALETTAGRVRRVYAGLPWAWYSSWRAVKLVYSAGYFTPANVPEDIKGQTLHLAAQIYREAEDGRIEIASGSNAMGTWARFGGASITKATRDALWASGHVRAEFDRTGEREFDEDAA